MLYVRINNSCVMSYFRRHCGKSKTIFVCLNYTMSYFVYMSLHVHVMFYSIYFTMLEILLKAIIMNKHIYFPLEL